MKIYLSKKMIDMLKWVLFQFIDTHSDSGDVYKDEIEQANNLLKIIYSKQHGKSNQESIGGRI